MQKIRTNRPIGWLVQGLLLLALCPLGTVQCYASAGGGLSVELTVNGVCLNCVSEGLECSGCTNGCCGETEDGLPSLGPSHQCGCAESPSVEPVAIKSTTNTAVPDLAVVQLEPTTIASHLVSRPAMKLDCKRIDRRRSPRSPLPTILRI